MFAFQCAECYVLINDRSHLSLRALILLITIARRHTLRPENLRVYKFRAEVRLLILLKARLKSPCHAVYALLHVSRQYLKNSARGFLEPLSWTSKNITSLIRIIALNPLDPD